MDIAANLLKNLKENKLYEGEKIMMESIPMDIQNLLQKVKFPAKKNDIIQQARQSGAMSDQLMENLDMLPDKEYKSVTDVAKELQRI
ncbi:MAG: DUF2795 domain-containing protein [Methanosarcina sp.]